MSPKRDRRTFYCVNRVINVMWLLNLRGGDSVDVSRDRATGAAVRLRTEVTVSDERFCAHSSASAGVGLCSAKNRWSCRTRTGEEAVAGTEGEHVVLHR